MINTIKKNWFVVALVIVILYLIGRSYTSNFVGRETLVMPTSGSGITNSKMAYSDSSFGFSQPAPSESSNRIVIQDTSLSLQVKDVNSEIKIIENSAKSLGGFLVNSYLSKPDSAASGNITVRVPETKLADALEIFKQNAVKVVSESVSGVDVTDQYSDLDAQLAVLIKTKSKFEDILDKAVSVSDLLNVQRELISLQSQIDSVKGQQKYYEQSAKLSKITIYLSTDELALPYAPTNEWRPAVIFKDAVRSLVGAFRSLGSLLIWGFVYLPIIIPVVLLLWFYKKHKK